MHASVIEGELLFSFTLLIINIKISYYKAVVIITVEGRYHSFLSPIDTNLYYSMSLGCMYV
jgi:hypothetical protein